ncbi:MAG: peptidyl-prolyl cis-trans isomerase [Polyangiaceae bacterium]|nr:peptidyl-prolyl cis-trans isomerase [Polyangiaceae bacterium]
MRRALAALALASCVAGCSKGSSGGAQPAASTSLPGGLTPELAAKPVAKVGDRVITLGEVAATLDGLNEFDRLRYQAPERRKELLKEMIELELLADEARRRGLDKTPETQAVMRQILRDAMLAEVKKKVPAPADLPQAEVRAYYEAHRAEYREPERRRVSAISLRDRRRAESALADAKKASPVEWGKLALALSEPPLTLAPGAPVEIVADLGIVGPPDDPRGDHPRVPPELRRAVFEITGDPGATLDRVVPTADGHFFLVRLAGKSPPHERSFAEAERSIRGVLVQRALEARAKELEADLARRFPVTVDAAALEKIEVSAPSPSSSHAAPPAPSR